MRKRNQSEPVKEKKYPTDTDMLTVTEAAARAAAEGYGHLPASMIRKNLKAGVFPGYVPDKMRQGTRMIVFYPGMIERVTGGKEYKNPAQKEGKKETP